MTEFKFKNLTFNSEKEKLKYIYENKEYLYTKISGWWVLVPIIMGFLTSSFLIFLFSLIIEIFLLASIEKYNEKHINNLAKEYLVCIENEKKLNKNIEKENKKKGLKLYKNKWYPNTKYNQLIVIDYENQIKKEESFLKETIHYLNESKIFQGKEMICKDCDYIWNIKKSKGKPSKCPNCNLKNIELLQIIESKTKIKKI